MTSPYRWMILALTIAGFMQTHLHRIAFASLIPTFVADLHLTYELESVKEIYRTKDNQEGIGAFLENRKPEYHGPHYPDYTARKEGS